MIECDSWKREIMLVVRNGKLAGKVVFFVVLNEITVREL